jgi:cytochrome c oxidase assembly factor CtaG
MTAGSAVLFSWAFEPLPLTGLLVTAVVYFLGWRKLHRQVPVRYPTWRLACFLAGLTAVAVALMSPLDAFASFLLISHMVQHLLLTMIAPPLIWMGAPQLPMLRGLPRRFVSQVLGPFLRWPVAMKTVHIIMHPVVCWSAFVLSNILWHIPAFYDLALRSWSWHEIEHFSFLGTALMFWWHVVLPWPGRSYWSRWAMLPYLLLAGLQNTALASFISFYDQVLYPTYAKAPRLTDFDALSDQAAAGAIMWVPGAIIFLFPAAAIVIGQLSPRRRIPPIPKKPPPEKQEGAPSGPLDLFKVPGLGKLLRGGWPRRGMQCVMVLLAAVIIIDGLLGPQISPLNLAGVLPWTHWRAATVIALLIFGNLFCMVCPFTFVRDLGRKILPAHLSWPRALRSKWFAVGLIAIYLWAYEAFDLWDQPAATAWIILGYFLGALLVDGFFKDASFCKFVCPIGQFHFVQSLVSPFEVKVRRPDVCASCRTLDCIKGNDTQRGCELKLFQPKKSGNMDCTFCMDCVQACPHDNVGLIAVAPGGDLISDRPRSSVGRYAKRLDLAALALVLTFGAFANAAGMVRPVLQGIAVLSERWISLGELGIVTLLAVLALLVLPLVTVGIAAQASVVLSKGTSWRENLTRFSLALVPLGFGMWLAHFVFHFFTAALTPWPVIQRLGTDWGLWPTGTINQVASWAFQDLPGLELLFLDAGLLLTLFVAWRIAGQIAPQKVFRAFAPWGVLATGLFLAGVWIVFQPMEMRGTLMP